MTIVLMVLFGQSVNAQWFTAGNNLVGGEVLGTNNNFSLNVRTNSFQRIKLNRNVTYTVNGHSAQRNGYMLLGHSQGFASSLFTSGTQGAFSQLHLNGPNGTFVQDGGYRPWMQTGVTLTDNNDMSYMGIRSVGSGNDITETVLSWSDNSGSVFPGPDDLCFRFTAGGSGVTSISSDLVSATDLDGRHIARFTGEGNIGFGPTFGTDNALYVTPQSLLHMSRDLSKPTWLQITNQSATGQGVNDGLRFGIESGGTANIRQQENLPLRVLSDWNTTPGGVTDGERMRITSIGQAGVRNPAGAPNDNITRVAISHVGDDPITDPVSLLHLGNDVGSLFASDDGWRDWMDVGIFINKTNDNIYVGLKKEEGATPLDDRYDAVINWGDNQDPVSPLEVGPDNLRFIFTSTNDIGAGDPVSTSNNGLEVARMEPTLASTLNTTDYDYGMMGIGNFAPGSLNDVNGTPVDAKLDIDGDLRIREVVEDTSLNLVLVIDTNDLGRVHYRTIGDLGGGVGNYCPDTQNPLTDYYEVPLNDFNYYFTGSQLYPDTMNNTNGVAIGLNCNDQLSGKLHVLQDEGNFISGSSLVSITGYFENIGEDAFSGLAVFGGADGIKEQTNSGGYFEALNAAKQNIGVQGRATSNTAGSTTVNVGGSFTADDGDINIGIYAQAGGDSVGGPDWAGFFQGDVNCSGGYYNLSDQSLKENISELHNASSYLSALNPVNYDFRCSEYPALQLPEQHQIGLIAQEVEQVLPTVVTDVVQPAIFDGLGNQISAPMELKTVNYVQLIPLLIAGFQEQEVQLAHQDSLNEKLNNQVQSLAEKLEAMEACLREVNLCGAQKNATQQTEPTFGQTIELKNRSAIILDQNLPNPFAEQTTITYTIPEEVMKAELVFYDMHGRIINQVSISERGESKMTVYGENLRNGVYTYSLIADGKLIATKKMVKQ